MFSLETTLLGVALALDAAVVSFTIGLLHLDLPKYQKTQRGLMVCGLFGFFQFLMVWLGSFGGYYLSFSSYGHMFQIIVALIFIVIGIRVLQTSFSKEDDHIEWGLFPMIGLAIATSIDALAAGVSIGTLPGAFTSSVEIGLITLVVCGGAYFAARIVKSLPTQWLLRVAAVIFFFLGGQILVDYHF